MTVPAPHRSDRRPHTVAGTGTAPAGPTTVAAPSAVAAFLRFVVCGGGVGLAAGGALMLLSGPMPMVVANILVTVVSTVIATELHSRISFRSARRGWRVHLQSGLTVAVSYVFTTGALLVLHAAHSAPSAAVEQGVYLSASALAGVGRFALLRLVVFARPAAGPPGPPVTAARGAEGRSPAPCPLASAPRPPAPASRPPVSASRPLPPVTCRPPRRSGVIRPIRTVPGAGSRTPRRGARPGPCSTGPSSPRTPYARPAAPGRRRRTAPWRVRR